METFLIFASLINILWGLSVSDVGLVWSVFLPWVQLEQTRFLFEAKTIQKMELLVLSALEWKMNPVTPVPFLQYFARRLGLKDSPCWEFLRRSELVLLSLISGE